MTNSRKSRSLAGLGLCAALATQCALADGQRVEVDASLTLGSDVLFRGVSQTLGGAAAQVSLDAGSESGVYAYLWASNVDFVPDSDPDDGARVEIDAGLGYAHELNDRWAAAVELVRYTFPGTVTGADSDYTELIANLWLDERYHAMIGYSNDVFASNAAGVFYSLGADYELPRDWSLSLTYGHYDLDDAYGASYSYAGVGISRPLGPVTLNLAYHDTFGDTEEIFYAQSTGSRFDLSIDIGLLQ